MPRTRSAIPMTCAAALMLGFSADVVAQTSETLPAYFGPSMPPSSGGGGCPSLPPPSPSAPTRWWQQTPPPENTDTCQTFAFGPLTDASEQPVGAFSTSMWGGGLWPRIWGRRGPRPPALGYGDPASNPVFPYINTPSCADPDGPVQPNMILGDDYTSVPKANAVTEAEILHMLGASQSAWQAPLLAQGFNMNTDVISYLALQANPGKFVNFRAGCNSHDGNSYVTIDKFILHDQPGWVYINGQSTPPSGVLIDWEVNDFRSPAQGAQFLVQVANDVHAQKLSGVVPQIYLYTNPWQYISLNHGVVGGMAANGFDFNHIDQVKAAFDFISLYLLDEDGVCNVNSAYNSEVANLSGVSGSFNPAEFVLTVDLYRCGEQNMLDIYNLNAVHGFGGYAIFPKNTNMGGQQLPLTGANLLIWRLMYGGRSPPNLHRP